MLLLIEETWLPEPLTCGVVCLWDLMRSVEAKQDLSMNVQKIIHFITQFGFSVCYDWLKSCVLTDNKTWKEQCWKYM